MATCSVRWRPSGGRGEFEFVPADSLRDREISVDFPALGVRIPAEVKGVPVQGKPRLRKFEPHNRRKFHLPQLVMAVAGLPEPARSDRIGRIRFPLENKAFVLSQLEFEVVEDQEPTIVLRPTRASVLHSDFEIQIGERLASMARDFAAIQRVEARDPGLAKALQAHEAEIRTGVNSTTIRETANELIRIKSSLFGMTNAGSALALIEAETQPSSEEEWEPVGTEGRILTRLHVFKERDRRFVKQVRERYRTQHGGPLKCEVCGRIPAESYGSGTGDRCIEAHHKVPIEQLQPDSTTRLADMAMVCACCHRVIHSQSPCLTIEEVQGLLNRQ